MIDQCILYDNSAWLGENCWCQQLWDVLIILRLLLENLREDSGVCLGYKTMALDLYFNYLSLWIHFNCTFN